MWGGKPQELQLEARRKTGSGSEGSQPCLLEVTPAQKTVRKERPRGLPPPHSVNRSTPCPHWYSLSFKDGSRSRWKQAFIPPQTPWLLTTWLSKACIKTLTKRGQERGQGAHIQVCRTPGSPTRCPREPPEQCSPLLLFCASQATPEPSTKDALAWLSHISSPRR